MIILAFLIGKQLLSYYYKKEGRPVEDVEKLSIYILLCCLVGARLGEIVFYSPAYYLKHPLEALLPISLSPTFHFTGYKGLSYHGALLGGLAAVYLYANYEISFSLFPFRFRMLKHKRPGQNFLWLLTPLAFGVLMGFFVRIGNFINSEILGTPTYSQHGVLFASDVIASLKNSTPIIQEAKLLKDHTPTSSEAPNGYRPIILELTIKKAGIDEQTINHFLINQLKNYLVNNPAIGEHLYEPADTPLNYTLTKNKKQSYIARIHTFGIPRHPVQLYESFSYVLTLLGLLYWWNRKGPAIKQGVIAGLATIISYSFRFVYEFFKDPFNILIPGNHPITTGHLLSLFTVLMGVIILIYAYRAPQTSQDNKRSQASN
jgi:prolipoprotein diacylglyceryltransferase